jgi:hypothetical protein
MFKKRYIFIDMKKWEAGFLRKPTQFSDYHSVREKYCQNRKDGG